MSGPGSPSTTATAANVQVILNNKVVGFCTAASWSIEYGNKPINALDSIVPVEIMPTSYKCTFSLSGVRILQKSFENLGFTSYPGVNLTAPYASLAIIERLSGTPMLNILAATIDSFDTQIQAKGLVTFSLTGTGFVALSGSNAGLPGYTGVPQQTQT